MTASSTKTYGLIGYPVKHSLSPLMHNAAFASLNINAEYRLFEVKPQELEDFVNSLSQKNIFGLNVTIPHKETVIPFLDSVSEEAKLIGAVNTIKVSDNRLEGFNTDGEGFLKHLTADLGFDPQGKIICIIGAGGASRAVSVYLSQAKPRSISFYDIDRNKSSALAGHLKENFRNVEFKASDSIEGLNIKECSLLVNATPIGLKQSDPCIVEEKLLHKDILVYDLIYNPKETKLLKIAKSKGAKVSNGLGMLLYQGAIAFQIWTGKTAPIEIMRAALEEGVRSL
jgi:shikimate dehydrogenase